VVAIFDSTGKQEIWSLKIPKALSLLYFFRTEGEVRGINQIQEEYEVIYGPGDYVPLVALSFWTFRIMVGMGLLLIALGAFALYLAMRHWPVKWTRWLRWMVWVIPIPYLANTAGWILTETGRQPWIVHGLLKTEDAVSPTLGVGTILISLISFVLIYVVLMAVDIYLLAKYGKAGPDADMQESANVALPDVEAQD